MPYFGSVAHKILKHPHRMRILLITETNLNKNISFLIMSNILLAFSFCVAFVTSSQHKFAIDQTTKESVILGEILSNYFIKYLSDDKIFVSIILPPSKKTKTHFLGDFFEELFDNPALSKFAYNTLDKLDDSIRDRRQAFNLILTDDWDSLP